jgi:hypothetical protein
VTQRKRTPQRMKPIRKDGSRAPVAATPDDDSERPTREIEVTLDEPLLSLPPPRDTQPTLTDESELERARLRSLQLSSFPPERPSSAGVDPILTMANAMAPSIPPIDAEEHPELPTAPPPPDALRAMERERSGDPLVDMRDRHSLGDYTGALQIADQILGEHPDHAEALACAESCREVLVKMYSARIGPLDRVPVVMVARNQLRWLSLDHRAGFVLSHIDGTSSLEMILDVSGMAPLDCLRILYELVQQRVISFR